MPHPLAWAMSQVCNLGNHGAFQMQHPPVPRLWPKPTQQIVLMHLLCCGYWLTRWCKHPVTESSGPQDTQCMRSNHTSCWYRRLAKPLADKSTQAWAAAPSSLNNTETPSEQFTRQKYHPTLNVLSGHFGVAGKHTQTITLP